MSILDYNLPPALTSPEPGPPMPAPCSGQAVRAAALAWSAVLFGGTGGGRGGPAVSPHGGRPAGKAGGQIHAALAAVLVTPA